MGIFYEEEELAFRLRQGLVDYLKKQGHIQTPQIEQAFRTVPRHLFLPGVELQKVYSDIYVATKLENDIPISSSSQPAIMAYMLEQLALQPGQRVLEIGAGTGYNAALMAHIVGDSGHIVTIDIDEDIVAAAQAHLQTAGWPQVQVLCADGSAGYPALAPYDRIILTVSADDIAPAWHDQLKLGGKIVLPFKFTQFRSMLYIPNLLPATDQVVLNLQNAGDHLESISMRGAGFMPLRGTFAVQTGQLFSLDPEQKLTLTSTRNCTWKTIFRHLKGAYSDRATNISSTYMDFWGLHTWLILREAAYCELAGHAHHRRYKNLPSLAQFADGSIATYGLCIDDSISLLQRPWEENPEKTDYWVRPFELVIRSFGPGNAPAQQLLMQINAWNEAGRPFQWYNWNLLQNIKIRVFPLESGYEAGPDELLSVRKGSRIVFAWRWQKMRSQELDNTSP